MTISTRSAIIFLMKKVLTIAITCLALPALLGGCDKAESTRVLHDEPETREVALLTLYSTRERGKVSPMLAAAGHSYVSIQNLTDSGLTLGKGYVLDSGATCTLASWEFDAHAGIWYNIEPTYISQGWFKARKSITRRVDADDLTRINAFLSDDGNDHWQVFDNCSDFALGMWNAAASGSGDEINIKHLFLPSQLEKQIKRFVEFEQGRPHESSQPIGYFSGDIFVNFTLEEQ